MVRADPTQSVEPTDAAARQLAPADHACLIHRGIDEEIDFLAPFLQVGLDNGEHCICFLGGDTTERLAALDGDGGFGFACATDSLTLYDASALLAEESGLAHALRDAGSCERALRVVVEQTRLLGRGGTGPALRLEAAIEEFLQERPACVLCCCDRGAVPAEQLIEMFHVHRLIVCGGKVRPNPVHVPPRELLHSGRAEQRLASLLAALERPAAAAEPTGAANGRGLPGSAREEAVLVRHLGEQARAFRALRESSRRFRTVLESVQDVAYKLNLERGTFSYVSPSAEKLLGFTPAELIAMGVRGTYRLVHPEDARRLGENTRALLGASGRDDVEPEIEFRIRRREGDYVWVCDSRRVVRDATDAPWAIVGIVRDISARKRAQVALQESGAEVDRVLHFMAERIFVKDRELKFIYANEPFAEDLGLPPHELVGKSDYDIFPEQMARQYRAEDRRVLEAGEPVVQENAWEDSESGRQRRQRWTKIPVRDSRGEVVALVGVASWSGERSEAEQMLSHWASLIVSAADAIVGVTLDGVILSWNSGARHIYGYAPEEALGSSISLLAPAGGAAELLGRIREVSQGDTVRGYETDHVTSDGRTVAVSLTISPLLGSEGAVVGASVTARDITERKRAQEALREQERALATLMRNLPGMAYRCRNDPEWTMEFLSEGCLSLTGHHPSALIENREVAYADLIHPEDREEVWHEVQRAVAENRPFRLTYRIRTAEGEERWVWEQGRAVLSEDGECAALEGFITDITERRRAQEQLQESRERYRELWDD
ncbi:MAG: PAS domain S-box protein, partial [Candidatus Brocadiaceae bacterium]